jgi:L-rhamnose mutarotase
MSQVGLCQPQSFMKIGNALVMSVNAGAEEEYKNRHNPIWSELERVPKNHGVSNFAIFLHSETRQLFGCTEIENEEQWAAIASEDARCLNPIRKPPSTSW